MEKQVQNLVGLVTALLAYSALLLAFWTTVAGAARLSMAARRDETARAVARLREAPGRCYLAGIAWLLVGWFLMAAGKRLGILALVLLLFWLRHVFRGLVAWMWMRGHQILVELEEVPPTDREALAHGLRATAMASALPIVGWSFLLLAALQGGGAESLRVAAPREAADPRPSPSA